MKQAKRVDEMLTFQAVKFYNLANKLAQEGKQIISLGIGEPDFKAPPAVIDALKEAADQQLSGYSPTFGLWELRQKIAEFYKRYKADVSPEQIIVTTGASGSLNLVCQNLLDPGDEVLLPEPYYPANYNFILAANAKPVVFKTGKDTNFQPTLEAIKANWTNKTRALILASPNNPTGTSIDLAELKKINDWIKSQGGYVILDEIYLPLSYEGDPVSGLSIDKDLIIINSFSKYFSMTGWRLGWIIAPAERIQEIERISCSLTICAPTLSQYAALACFEPETIAIYEERRQSFKERRDYLVPELNRLGLEVPAIPSGAFYIFADISKYSNNSVEFALDLLKHTGVVVTPGEDFGPSFANNMIRLSYATSMEDIKTAITLIEQYLNEFYS